ncbi:MAG: sigma-E processing peptidase SpoIIGA, partial [Ruminiclostridium sp.]|nr:sigma-E processing peptidase SpoIIGA [Ruminiclostridium sp.]
CAFTALTVLTAFGFGNVKLFALRSFVSISVSMLICGAAVLTRELTGSDFIFSANGYVYLNISALVLVISSAVIYGVLTLLRRILDSPVADERFSLTVRNLGVTAELTAIADTGNCLRDWLTGRPVIVCKPEAVRAVTPANVTAYLCGVTDDVAGIRLLPLNTVSGSGIAAAFRPDSVNMRLRGTEKRLDALIAVTEGALEGESFDAVIPAKLLQTI